MKFKLEVCLLAFSIGLFAVSMFFYGYQTGNGSLNLSWASYPYRGYSLPIVGFGSALMVTGYVSYSKRSKNILA
jgi:hypothetical protein